MILFEHGFGKSQAFLMYSNGPGQGSPTTAVDREDDWNMSEKLELASRTICC